MRRTARNEPTNSDRADLSLALEAMPTAISSEASMGGRRTLRPDRRSAARTLSRTEDESRSNENGARSPNVLAELVELVAERAAELVAERLAPFDVGEGWIGVEEAAEYLACPKSRVYALVSAGRIPYCKDGSRTLFKRSELDLWVQGGGARRP